MKKKIHKLQYSTEEKSAFIAISSHEKDYYLCWKLNNKLVIDLKKNQDFEVVKSKNEIIQKFSIYDFIDEKYSITYKLISNKCEKGFLLEEFNNIDYFLKITGNLTKEKITLILTKIKQTESVITAFEFDKKNIKSKNSSLI